MSADPLARAGPAGLRCVYTDLDGTLLGRGGSLFRDGDDRFTLLPARGLEACFRAGVEVVLKSGRRRAQVAEDARLMGQQSYIYEVGCGLVIDGEETLIVGDYAPRDGATPHELIERSGAPALLLERYRNTLEYHSPWHRDREISHLMRGLVDVEEANRALEDAGIAGLRLVDNGAIGQRPSLAIDGPPHAYHLIPAGASKADAVARHMRARGYSPAECIAVGDSREDLGVAAVVGRFFLVANAVERDPTIATNAPANATITEAGHGDGFYEAVIASLAERRGPPSGHSAW